MAIPRSSSLTVPAIPEKTFDSVWVRSINIHCPQLEAEGNNGGQIHIELVPYDATEGAEAIHLSLNNEGIEYVNVDGMHNPEKSFWKCVNDVPEVAKAMEAIVSAVSPLKTWIETVPEVEATEVEGAAAEETSEETSEEESD
jgi:hypothetical protein